MGKFIDKLFGFGPSTSFLEMLIFFGDVIASIREKLGEKKWKSNP